MQPALRRHEPRQGGRGVRRFDQARHPVARIPVGRGALRLGLLRPALRMGRRTDPQGTGLRGRSDAGGDPRKPRHGLRAGYALAVARPVGRGEPRPVRAYEERRIPRRREGAAREDRHGPSEHALPRPDHVPHHPRRTPPHGRQVVHLPDVRLRPRTERLDRADHPLDLHARIRRPPP